MGGLYRGAGLALLSEVSSAVIPLSVEAYARDIAAAARAAVPTDAATQQFWQISYACFI